MPFDFSIINMHIEVGLLSDCSILYIPFSGRLQLFYIFYMCCFLLCNTILFKPSSFHHQFPDGFLVTFRLQAVVVLVLQHATVPAVLVAAQKLHLIPEPLELDLPVWDHTID